MYKKSYNFGSIYIFVVQKDFMIILSSILITLALVFYSTGIWAERIAHLLKPWHMLMLKKFHKFSIIVWLIWLIPYFGGMFLGMSH